MPHCPPSQSESSGALVNVVNAYAISSLWATMTRHSHQQLGWSLSTTRFLQRVTDPEYVSTRLYMRGGHEQLDLTSPVDRLWRRSSLGYGVWGFACLDDASINPPHHRPSDVFRQRL